MEEGLSRVTKGGNAMAVRTGMEKARDAAVAELKQDGKARKWQVRRCKAGGFYFS